MPARRPHYILLSQSAEAADQVEDEDQDEQDQQSNFLHHHHHHHHYHHHSLPDRIGGGGLGFDPQKNLNLYLPERQQRLNLDFDSEHLLGLGRAWGVGVGGVNGNSSSNHLSRGVFPSNGLQRQSSGSSFAESSLSSDYPLPTLSPTVSLNASDSAFFNGGFYEEGERLKGAPNSNCSWERKNKNWAQQTEESYHLQLALALRVSAEASFAEDPHLLVMDEGAVASFSGSGGSGRKKQHVEGISHRFWVNGCLSYHDKIPDGFYDIWGMNPYIWAMCNDLTENSRLPSLESLKTVDVKEASLEIVLIDKRGDSHLKELENRALALAYGCSNSKEVFEQLGKLVCMLMGGAFSTEHEDLMMLWKARSKMLVEGLNSIILPIGSLSVGLCRHRALLFKVLADAIDLPCRIARGCKYCGMDDGSSCLVQCGEDREYLIDLIGTPGLLCEPDSFLNGPSSSSIASPLRLPDLKSSLFTDDFRSLAKQYMADCKSLDLLFDKVSTEKQVSSEIPVKYRTEEPLEAANENHSPTCKISSDTGLMSSSSLSGAVQELSGQFQEEDQLLRDVDDKSLNKDTFSVLVNPADGESPQHRFLQGCKQRDLQSRFNEDGSLHQVWLKGYKQKNELIKDSDEECRQMRIAQRHKDGSSKTELTRVPNKIKDGRLDETGRVLTTEANLELSLAMDGLEIPWSDLVLKERIGAGSFGTVHRADWHGSDVAVKILIEQDFYEERLKEFLREVAIMKRLRHPNVVLFMGAVLSRPNLSIVTEYLPRGSLYRLIHRPGTREILDERRRLRMALDVSKGMNYLHRCSPPIVHRDLKSPNLLVDRTWTVKVGDFGLSRLKANTFLSSKSAAGTAEWMAPEVLRDEPSNEKSDVYSFGVILWELITMQQPWSGLNPAQVVGAVGFQHRRLQIPKDMNPEIAAIIESCWVNEPRKRPSFASIMDSLKPLIKPLNSQTIRGIMQPPA